LIAIGASRYGETKLMEMLPFEISLVSLTPISSGISRWRLIAQRCRQSAIGNFLGVTAIICLKGFGYKLAQVPLLIGKPDEFELTVLCDAKDENLVGVGVAGRREGGFADREVRIASETRGE
jgi:hypothetical protein